jgi:signal transduction histidine kinase/CheY-like chemotaxis protein
VRLSGIGFWYCDLPFDELVWDARVKAHFFLPPDAKVTIDTFYERILPEDRALTRAAIEASIRDRTTYDVVYRTHDPVGGSVKWIRAMGGTSYAADGTPLRFDGVTVDVSEQKRSEARMAAIAAQLEAEHANLEQARSQAEAANRAKDDFLAMLGHELRNPLSPIITAVQVLKLRGIESREIMVIERQAQHLSRLVDDLLDVSRITSGKVTLDKQPCELAEIVVAAIETASPLFESAQHTLVTNVTARGLVVDVDRVRMTQVISNLLTNAAKYTKPRGRISIAAHSHESEIVISVEDNGEGIPDALLPHIFDMFVQSRQTIARSQGGLGLGLALVKSLVMLHGGSVSAHSAGPGRGCTFQVRLPAAQATASQRIDGAFPAKNGAAEGKRILVVDDNDDSVAMLAEALEAFGYRTAVAHDGASALEVASAFAPHVALLDIGLPVMDGYELAQRLRERHADLTLFALTGYGQPEDRERSRQAGFLEHLTKPLDLDELSRLLEWHDAPAARTDGASVVR